MIDHKSVEEKGLGALVADSEYSFLLNPHSTCKLYNFVISQIITLFEIHLFSFSPCLCSHKEQGITVK